MDSKILDALKSLACKTTKPFLKINNLERINLNSIITEVVENTYIL